MNARRPILHRQAGIIDLAQVRASREYIARVTEDDRQHTYERVMAQVRAEDEAYNNEPRKSEAWFLIAGVVAAVVTVVVLS